MKTISKATATLISDFSAETELSLPAYALEKDYHVLDAIKIVSAMPPSAYFSLVFCGGTCLSKAYGILERMSEDVDFKVVPNEAGRTLGTAALRREMSAYVKSIMATLETECFGKDSVVRRSRDDNKYSALVWNAIASITPIMSTIRRELPLISSMVHDVAHRLPAAVGCFGSRQYQPVCGIGTCGTFLDSQRKFLRKFFHCRCRFFQRSRLRLGARRQVHVPQNHVDFQLKLN